MLDFGSKLADRALKQFLKVNLLCVFNFRTFVRQLRHFETTPDEYETTIRRSPIRNHDELRYNSELNVTHFYDLSSLSLMALLPCLRPCRFLDCLLLFLRRGEQDSDAEK